MSRSDIIVALSPVVDAFIRLGIRYHIGGSVASSAHGVPRATLDIDLVADLTQAAVRPFTEALRAEYYVDDQMISDAIKRCASFNLVHLDTMIKIDVFVLKGRAYDRQAFERMQADTLEEGEDARKFFLATPEDTILNKLEWYKLGGEVSDRQWRDVLGVLKVQQSSLDYEYMRHWAGDIGLSDLLERAIDRSQSD